MQHFQPEMEEEIEFEMIRVRAKEGRSRRRALGSEGIDFRPDEEDTDEKENSGPCLRDKTKTRLQRLGILYGDGEISSPIHKSEDRWVEEEEEESHPTCDKYSEERSRRLAALANTINSWEDDIRHISPKKEEVERIDRFGNKVGSKAVKHEVVQAAPGKNRINTPHTPSPKKKVAWDKKIITSLEMQGFKRCESEEHLVYDYVSPNSKECTSPRKTPGKKAIPPKKEVDSSTIPHREPQPLRTITQNVAPRNILQERKISPVKKQSPQKSAVLEMAAQFESSTSPTKPKNSTKDPALMSVAEKRAVFERNNGFVPVPQAPISVAPGAAPQPAAHRPQPAPAQQQRPQHVPLRERSPPRKVFQPISPAAPTPPSDSSPVRHNVNQAVIDRFKEIEALRHRWDRNKVLSSLAQVNQNDEERERSPERQRTPSEQDRKPQIPVPPPLPPPASPMEYGGFTPSPPKKSPVRGEGSPQSKIKMGTKSPIRQQESPRQHLPRVLSVREKSTKREFQYPEVKRIKVSPPKPGRLYPSISDIETESEVPESDLDPIEEELSDIEEGEGEREELSFGCSTELESSRSSASSFGQQIVRQASKTNLKRPSTSLENSSEIQSSASENESRILREMDDLLDEALGEPSPKRSRDSENNMVNLSGLSPSSQTCASTSFEFSSAGRLNEAANNVVKEKTPLIHTVSVYRKQQNMTTTPIRREIRHDEDYNVFPVKQNSEEQTISEEELVLARIKELETEVQRQLETISQASKALNLCLSTPGFSGSSAEVEAQKLLLIANARWNAMNQEIERLKIERKLKPGLAGGRVERGDITLSGLSLPVKAFQSSDTSMSVIVLVRSGSVVLHTEVLSIDRKTIRGGRLSFQKVITLKGLYSDFTASVEVYGYAKKSLDLHDRDPKNRTTPKKDKHRTTPKKNKDKGFLPVESPAGPNAVRTSAFQLWGFAVFSLREVSRKSFTLNKVPYTCPLEGSLEVSMSSSMQSQVEHAGFLTVYEDVSGFGAWKRRWAVLRGSAVAFWAYPDQCKEGKVALDTIDLASVATAEAGLAPRELCARPHTILLESHIKDLSIPESLVARRQGDVTVIMHLLSADTKEERLQWCEQLNKVLYLLRAWKVSKNA